MDFQLLPLEIKFHIFAFLTEYELRGKVSTVCEEWRSLADDPYLKTNFTFTNEKPQDIVVILQNHYRIRKLEFVIIDNWKWIHDISNIKYLRKLTLFGCKIQSTTISQLTAKTPLIQELEVLRCQNLSMDCMTNVPETKSLKTLHLNFTHRNRRNCGCADGFLQNCYNAKEIKIVSPPPRERGFLKLVLYSDGSLEKLNLNCKHISDDAFWSLAGFRRLLHLCLTSADDLSIIGFKTIKGLTHLQRLFIFGCDDDFTQFFRGMSLPGLVVLEIESMSLINETLHLLAECCPSLRRLVLCGSGDVSDCGLIDIIMTCGKLEVLSLNRMNSLDGMFLKQIVTRLPKLVHLNLFACIRIFRGFCVDLKQRRPALQIVDSYGKNVNLEYSADYNN